MKSKFTILLLFLSFFVLSQQAYAVKVYTEREYFLSKINKCSACKPSNKGPRFVKAFSHDMSDKNVVEFYKKISNRERDDFCRLAKKAVSDLSGATLNNIENGNNKNFTWFGAHLAKYFAQSIPNFVSVKHSYLETSDYKIYFYGNNLCSDYGRCYARIDLNKDKKPNIDGSDIFTVVLIQNSDKNIVLEDTPGGKYIEVMCGNQWKHLNKTSY